MLTGKELIELEKPELIELLQKNWNQIQNLNTALAQARGESKALKIKLESAGDIGELEKRIIELENCLYTALEQKRGYRGELRILKNKCDLLQIQLKDYRDLLIAFGEKMKDGKAG